MKPTHSGEWFLLAALALWWLLSLLIQPKSRWLGAAERIDILGLLPRYRFFAPRPKALDYFIEVRTRTSGQDTCAWTRIPFDPPRFITTFWAPGAEARNMFNTLAFLLVRRTERRGENDARNSAAARHLLAWAESKFWAPGVTSLQFQVLTSKPLDHSPDPKLRFRSDWHALPR